MKDFGENDDERISFKNNVRQGFVRANLTEKLSL
jgi:hypothetical protein